ncbi:MAG: SIMPL domain-containing protein, partial [Novosphingobium sp.]
MKRLPLIAALAMGTSLVAAAPAAMAQQTSPMPTIQTGHTLLTVSAEGSSARTPDMARYSAGVTTQGATASEALSANSAQMNRVMAALKQAGIADRDIQTSNLNLRPVYAQPKRQPDGSYDESEQRIVAYRATNTVSVRQRKLED